jgi:CopG family transcriptional regulator, nickel-responsive regulator
MERVTISLSDELAAELAAFMTNSGYENRSEAIRDLVRLGLERRRIEEGAAGDSIAMLSYVFDHHTRELPKRLTATHHAHHGLQVATLHVHLDSDSCLEVAVLRGETGAIRGFAQSVIAERGVTHGRVTFVPILARAEGQTHPGGAPATDHLHAHPGV